MGAPEADGLFHRHTREAPLYWAAVEGHPAWNSPEHGLIVESSNPGTPSHLVMLPKPWPMDTQPFKFPFAPRLRRCVLDPLSREVRGLVLDYSLRVNEAIASNDQPSLPCPLPYRVAILTRECSDRLAGDASELPVVRSGDIHIYGMRGEIPDA